MRGCLSRWEQWNRLLGRNVLDVNAARRFLSRAYKSSRSICFHDGRRQPTAVVSTGIDRDPIAMDFRKLTFRRRVTMNDHLPEQPGVLKKFVSYPSKIERVLVREADAWPDTRMHKAEIACFDFVDGRPEQFDMMIVVVVHQRRKLLDRRPLTSAIGLDSLPPAETRQPLSTFIVP